MMAGMPEALSPAAGRPARQVYCLCAEWCGVCREWRPAFDALAASHPGDRFAWIDVDAHEEVLDTVEIETFPVLLIAEQENVLFFGAMEPSAGMLQRLVDRVDRSAIAHDPVSQRLLAFLQTLAPTG